MLRPLLITLALASLASASTTFIVIVEDGDTLADSSLFSTGTPYLAVFQLTGGTTSDSVADILGIDLGGGSADVSSISATPGTTYGLNGLADGYMSLKVIPSDSYTNFIQQFTAGTQFKFTVTLTGVFSPPTPDQFAFQLYDQNFNVVYEQAFNVTDSAPAPVPEPSSVALVGAGLAMAWVGWFRAPRFDVEK